MHAGLYQCWWTPDSINGAADVTPDQVHFTWYIAHSFVQSFAKFIEERLEQDRKGQKVQQ